MGKDFKRKRKDDEDECSKPIKYRKEWATNNISNDDIPDASNQQTKRLPKKKVALFLMYSGAGYQGMQINPNAKTVEYDLHLAFAKAGAVSPENAMDPGKINFMRAARTDKGVHSAGQLCSFKMIIDDTDPTYPQTIIEKINKNLPPQIRVLGYKVVMKGFHAKNQCGSRMYEYIMPSYVLQDCNEVVSKAVFKRCEETRMFLPLGQDEVTEDEKIANSMYRVTEEKVALLKEVLGEYVGTRNYHNFTTGKKFGEESSKRNIISFEISKTFIKKNVEFISLKVHGQSFMLHQIRKMVGLAILICRLNVPSTLPTKLFQNLKVNIPKAPALGLLLVRPVYDGYNQKVEFENLKIRKDETPKEKIEFDEFEKTIDLFKDEWIYEPMIKTELETNETIERNFYEYRWFLNADGVINLDLRPENLFAHVKPKEKAVEEVKQEIKEEIKLDVKQEVKQEVKLEVKEDVEQLVEVKQE